LKNNFGYFPRNDEQPSQPAEVMRIIQFGVAPQSTHIKWEHYVLYSHTTACF